MLPAKSVRSVRTHSHATTPPSFHINNNSVIVSDYSALTSRSTAVTRGSNQLHRAHLLWDVRRSFAVGVSTAPLGDKDWIGLAEKTRFGERIPGSTAGELHKQTSMDFEDLKRGMQIITVHQMLESKPFNGVLSLTTEDSAWDAIREMSKNNVGSVLVRDPSSTQVVGVFTERDYVGKLILKGRQSAETPLSDVMSKEVLSVTPVTSLADVGEMMAYKGIRHLPVTRAENDLEHVIGVISSRDVMDFMVNNAITIKCARKEMLKNTLTDIFEYMEAGTSSQEFYVDEDSSVFQALKLMDKHKIGGVFVCNGQSLNGVFTERDYLNRIILQNRSSSATRIGDVMTSDVITASPNTSVFQALKLMVDNKIRTLPIMSLIGREIDDSEYITKRSLFGMITGMDVIKFIHKLERGRPQH